jgi:arylsulfatase A-like enzyme
MPKTSVPQKSEHSSMKRSLTRRDFLSTGLKAGAAAAFTTGLLPNLDARTTERYNVLFIIVDDLRPMLGCYGYPEIHTPNIDALAQRGTLFNRAYCQYPLCNPSRSSILTGLRPETTNIVSNSVGFREKLPNVVTLPQHFKRSGYHTQSVGKITHSLTMQDDAYSWSTPSWRQPIALDLSATPSWQALDVGDDELRDGKAAKHAAEVLRKIQNIPFFLAVGFRKPHLPFHVPKRYYELYKTEDFDLPSTSGIPSNAPTVINSRSNWIREFQDIPNRGAFSDEKTLELIQGYAASTSYMDAQVGRILNQLDVLGLTENTVTIFTSDHGFHLGEHGIWKKNTLFEVSVRSPLIVSVPGQTHIGVKTDALAELVDIYPTLCDACQIPIPQQLEGTSLMPIIEQPTRPWKTAAFSSSGGAAFGGISIRTDRYRYTERGENARYGRELYDYDADPDETVNIANLPENAQLIAHLSERLHAGWQAALPDVQERIPVPQTLPWDINNDGVVNIQDLVLVSSSLGMETPEHPKVDVNKDGGVDIIDLLLVAAHFGESVNSAAPSVSTHLHAEHVALVEGWLTEARFADDGSDIFRQGIATLEHLIHTTVPPETVLLPNYPNPFNPETWIPYDLAADADVHIHIYNLKGQSIRQLSLGFQTAGSYRTSSRAAYWDGRNAVGETVASGIYFYTFQAGPFSATRQMVILK